METRSSTRTTEQRATPGALFVLSYLFLLQTAVALLVSGVLALGQAWLPRATAFVPMLVIAMVLWQYTPRSFLAAAHQMFGFTGLVSGGVAGFAAGWLAAMVLFEMAIRRAPARGGRNHDVTMDALLLRALTYGLLGVALTGLLLALGCPGASSSLERMLHAFGPNDAATAPTPSALLRALALGGLAFAIARNAIGLFIASWSQSARV